ncbi:MAG TPA: hypothetical protein VHK88_02120, partial [Aquihabitans sp.]|nr:hypothetical protein [Aquihabitans sp.]
MTAPHTGPVDPDGRADRASHPDRAGLPTWLVVALAAATGVAAGAAGSVAVARRSGSPTVGLLAGAFVGVLAVVGLPSISIRLAARAVLAASVAALVRFGALSGPITSGSQAVLAWVVAAVAVFVLTDRVATEAQPGLVDPP